ncbi:MAG: hypothetical protein OXH13_04820 [Chloroflexi bacterium]|nr:hypothetical protein [Chloroflexota bacterium]MCY3696134.1 hypothetical protein [Chloroflexota bacterium]
MPTLRVNVGATLVVARDGSWIVAQGPEWTGRIVTTADLRKYGAVRPRTRMTFDD